MWTSWGIYLHSAIPAQSAVCFDHCHLKVQLVIALAVHAFNVILSPASLCIKKCILILQKSMRCPSLLSRNKGQQKSLCCHGNKGHSLNIGIKISALQLKYRHQYCLWIETHTDRCHGSITMLKMDHVVVTEINVAMLCLHWRSHTLLLWEQSSHCCPGNEVTKIAKEWWLLFLLRYNFLVLSVQSVYLWASQVSHCILPL